jgi:hypothetical protein
MDQRLVPALMEQMTDTQIEAVVQRYQRAGKGDLALEVRHYARMREFYGADQSKWPHEAFKVWERMTGAEVEAMIEHLRASAAADLRKADELNW